MLKKDSEYKEGVIKYVDNENYQLVLETYKNKKNKIYLPLNDLRWGMGGSREKDEWHRNNWVRGDVVKWKPHSPGDKRVKHLLQTGTRLRDQDYLDRDQGKEFKTDEESVE